MPEDDAAYPRPLSQANARDRLSIRFCEAFNDRDFATMAALSSSDVEFNDHRSGLSTRIVGLDAHMEQLRVMTELGMYQEPNIALGRHGEKTLLDITWTNRDPLSPIEVRTLMVVDNAGETVRRLWIFDPEDLDSAKACLEG
jgi:hypothetical protein